MFKFFSFLAIIILSVKAAEYTIDVQKARVIATPHADRYVTVNTNKKGSVLTWKTDIDKENGQMKIRFTSLERINGGEQLIERTVENLCGVYDDEVLKNIQLFALQYILNTKNCPIKKGSKTFVTSKGSIPLEAENLACGHLSWKYELFSNDSDRLLLVIGISGNVKDGNCE